jgi:predicted nuclease of predicted toxin-antitoxin system
MKFLLNMNLPPELGRRLATNGHQWRHVANLGMARASDTHIIAAAKDQGECILTHDLDYGQILAPSPATLSHLSSFFGCVACMQS